MPSRALVPARSGRELNTSGKVSVCFLFSSFLTLSLARFLWRIPKHARFTKQSTAVCSNTMFLPCRESHEGTQGRGLADTAVQSVKKRAPRQVFGWQSDCRLPLLTPNRIWLGVSHITDSVLTDTHKKGFYFTSANETEQADTNAGKSSEIMGSGSSE